MEKCSFMMNSFLQIVIVGMFMIINFKNCDCINPQDGSKCNTHGEKKWASQLVLIDFILLYYLNS